MRFNPFAIGMTGKHKMSTLTGQLNYSAMEHIVTMVKGKNGPIKCLILPMESNWIEETVKDGKTYIHQGIAVYDIAPEKQKNGQTHTIKINPKKEIKEALKAAGKYTPFLGNLKDWSAPTAEVNTSEQFEGGADLVPDGSDLPF